MAAHIRDFTSDDRTTSQSFCIIFARTALMIHRADAEKGGA
jgi:hypothetical protein